MKESPTEISADSTETILSKQHDYERTLDSNESVCEAVVSAVTALENVDMADLEPLYSAVDGDALERVTSSNSVSCVSFDYVGYRVEVHDGSRVVISPAE
ncbi:HalOD1 output domain-containing protein [Haladaptatus sp. AB643]|uniref:HalOD1 output domain-containing protein n=1 Tax=Haladaptatus sp. AB643 TaxID=2934174 RepID=UPI00209BEB7D|nr:HalOD1 output domain-containing protein [Haladaptatus sp. AB643]MCO8244674.1 hypothetical protein [Haladaptatus sp. AB643]